MQLPVTSDGNRKRLDAWLASQMHDLSRARIQSLIKDGHILVDGRTTTAHQKLRTGQSIQLHIPEPVLPSAAPEDIPLSIVFEDAHILVLNKPAGLVVHPAAGHASGTLVNALLNHCKDLAGIGGTLRPGIVHRLDKDTSGLMVVAKSDRAMAGLIRQFKNGEIQKTYLALVRGIPTPRAGHIQTLIGRDPRHRKKMSATPAHGRPALSDYAVAKEFQDAALVRVTLHTGRTHQIRVHMTHIGHPILGDPVYGGRRSQWRGPDEAGRLTRQMLHAAILGFTHPVTGKTMTFEAPLPPDMAAVLAGLTECGAGVPSPRASIRPA